MLCEGNNPVIKITDVRHLSWESGYFDIPEREHSALAFRMKGDAVITCNGISHSITAHDVLYMPQNMPYTAEYGETEIFVIHFLVATNDKNAEVYKLSNIEEIHKLFLRTFKIWKEKETGYELLTMSNLYKILGCILKNQVKEDLPPHFSKAVSFIDKNFKDTELSVPLICKNSGICETALRNLFNKHYGKTPTDYIKELRIDYAKNLISSGVSIEETAILCGFNDSKYFARVVKKTLGCTPSDLKKFGK